MTRVVMSIVFSLLALCFLTASMAQQPRDDTVQGCPPPPRGQVGVALGSAVWNSSPDEVRRELELAHDAGAHFVRVDVDWSRIEPERGTLDWSSTDQVVDAVIAAGMVPTGLVAYTPRWAANPADGPPDTHFRPRDPALFARFAETAAIHFRARIPVWEVWNEPNLTDFYKPTPNLDEYTALLTATYKALKSVDTELIVVSGGLSPAIDGNGDITPVMFTEGLYARGANRYFDALGMHPYTFPALPDDPSTAPWNAFLQMWQMHDVMARGEDGAKTIWMTEFGAPTGNAPDAVTEQVQAQTIKTVLTRARETSWLGPAFVYSLRDMGTDPSDREQNFGLLRRDFSAKPSYSAIRQIRCP